MIMADLLMESPNLTPEVISDVSLSVERTTPHTAKPTKNIMQRTAAIARGLMCIVKTPLY